MVSKEKEAKHNEVIVDFLKTHEKATAVDIAERLYSTIHMSVGEVQLYLGELIDKKTNCHWSTRLPFVENLASYENWIPILTIKEVHNHTILFKG